MSEVKPWLINRAKFADVLREAHEEGIGQCYGTFRDHPEYEEGPKYCGIGLLLYHRPDVFPTLSLDHPNTVDNQLINLMHMSSQEFAQQNDVERLTFKQLADWLMTAPEVTELFCDKEEYADDPNWDECPDAESDV